MTLGEKLIRPEFAKNDEVRELKRQFVILIDRMDTLRFQNYIKGEEPGSPEYEKKGDILRATEKAIDSLELASMFAVKALTA